MSEMNETRDLIKKAALERFSTYGFGKTTMVEIGKDCDMSAANLYRFYKNKQDIAVAIAEDHFAEEYRVFREIVQRNDLSPPEKIRAYVMKSIDITSECMKERAKLVELVGYVCSEQKDVVQCHVEQKQSIMAEILAEGNRTGDFAVDDIFRTSVAVLKAFIFFDYPAFIVSVSEEKMREYAEDVVNLVLSGLNRR